jgi:hypothetical protein
MRARLAPVRSRRLIRSIREPDLDAEPFRAEERRPNAYADLIVARMTERFDLYPLAVERESAHERAVPQVERLLDLRQIFRGGGPSVAPREPEADASQMKAVRIRPQPLDLWRAAIAGYVGVAHLPAVALERREPERLNRPLLRVWRGVPPPLGQRPERYRLVVGVGEGLKAGDVRRERELAVSDAERRLAIEVPEHRDVARDERPSIDGRFGLDGEQAEQEDRRGECVSH